MAVMRKEPAASFINPRSVSFLPQLNSHLLGTVAWKTGTGKNGTEKIGTGKKRTGNNETGHNGAEKIGIGKIVKGPNEKGRKEICKQFPCCILF